MRFLPESKLSISVYQDLFCDCNVERPLCLCSDFASLIALAYVIEIWICTPIIGFRIWSLIGKHSTRCLIHSVFEGEIGFELEYGLDLNLNISIGTWNPTQIWAWFMTTSTCAWTSLWFNLKLNLNSKFDQPDLSSWTWILCTCWDIKSWYRYYGQRWLVHTHHQVMWPVLKSCQ